MDDLRFACRVLWKAKIFSAAAILTLVVCVGGNTALFAVVEHVLLRPLRVPEADRVITVYNSYPKAGADHWRRGRARLPGSAARHDGVRRAFKEEEGEIGRNDDVVLSDGLWHSLFGARPDVIGQAVRLDGRPATVVGVMPPDVVFIDPNVQAWVPLALTDQEKTQRHAK